MQATLDEMAKVWILDTETKGTGANVVPLEKSVDKRSPEPAPLFVPPERRPAPAPEPAPPAPLRFKVVDVMTERVLAQGTGVRETVETLAGARSVVDIRVYVWDREPERWRMLTLGEQKDLWRLRDRPGRGARHPARRK